MPPAASTVGAARPPLASMFDAPPDETSGTASGGASTSVAMPGQRQQQQQQAAPSLATMFDAPPTDDEGRAKAAGGLGGSGGGGGPTRPAASEKSSLLEAAEKRQQGYSEPGFTHESRTLSRQETLGATHSTTDVLVQQDYGSGSENLQRGSADQASSDSPSVSVRRRASTRFGAGWLLLNDTYITESWDEEKVDFHHRRRRGCLCQS